jgi:hypothetical protein
MKYEYECPKCHGGPIYQDRDDALSGCAHCDDCGEVLSPDEFIILEKNHGLSRALRAICLTRDYVGKETLPALKGWEWFDAGRIISRLIPDDEWVKQFRLRVNGQ